MAGESIPATGRASVILDVAAWLDQGERVWLCTIVETWGSSPRPVGSWLAISASGRWSGSVSGGCLEEDLLRRTASSGPTKPVAIDYGITDDDRDQFQLPCGGRIRLLVEPLQSAEAENHVAALALALKQRRPVTRRVRLDAAPELVSLTGPSPSSLTFDGDQLEHVLQPECRLLLIGAGEVARYVADFAAAADFEVTLCEPRDAFAEGWGYPHIPLERALPDDLIGQRFNDPWSGVLALAHDPRIDDMGLLAALASRAFYVGAMGSRKTSEARRERLASLGLDQLALDRLRAPIGVDIPSKTPAEIAISVVADVIAARHHLRAALPSL
ncbi:XdhC family protein [Marinobacter sp. F4206]|uniref:XdhC family protein n=1 Tax=Marinobacter sp. F4206 TaxID=2861777 RepID=UPI001C5E651C|nr:XdhC family protein [Marinobacter sp. F4206]MBW4936571.1 XdhC family protein [Marinobacter sp. F4206]